MQTIDKTPTEEVSSMPAENVNQTPEDAITISASLFEHVIEATQMANEVVEACDDDDMRAISEFTAYLEHRCIDWDDSWDVQVDTAHDYVDFALIDADRTAVSSFFRHMKTSWDNEINYHRHIGEVQRWLKKAIKSSALKLGGAR